MHLSNDLLRFALVLSLWTAPGCAHAPTAPRVEDCQLGFYTDAISCHTSDGAEVTRKWGDLRYYICHPPADEAAYITYCASKR